MSFAATESRLLSQRTREGIARVQSEGRKVGRPRKVTLAQRLAPRLSAAAEGMRRMQPQGKGTVSDR
jgi:DNA invertase Pin-like site-specific DNA recombinase